MINEALSCICEEMNEYFKNRLEINDNKVVLSNIVNHDGSIPIVIGDKIILTLTNIEKGTTRPKNSSLPLSQTRPLHIDVLFSAYFNEYTESLKFISWVIEYFQSRKVYDHTNTPELDQKIDKMDFDMIDLTLEQLNSIWSVVGGKYIPSVVYKISIHSIDESILTEIKPEISNINPDAK